LPSQQQLYQRRPSRQQLFILPQPWLSFQLQVWQQLKLIDWQLDQLIVELKFFVVSFLLQGFPFLTQELIQLPFVV
jgi:hypothetical protein